MNLAHRIRWFLLSGGADAEGGGIDGIGGLEEARREDPVADAINGAITEYGSALFAGRWVSRHSQAGAEAGREA